MKSGLKVLQKPTALHLLIIAGVVIILSIPFIGQPFHMDDRDFLEFARVSAQKLTKFHIRETSYGGVHVEYIRSPHGPLLTTYLGVLLRLGVPESEPWFHAAYIVFPLIAALSMYALARRFTGHPLSTALLLFFTPGFLVLSHTIMGNLPGLSFGLAAASLYIWGVDRDSWKLLAASGIALLLTALTAYQALSLVPAFLVYGLLKKPQRLMCYLPFTMLAAGGIAWIWIIWQKFYRFPEISYIFGLNSSSTIPWQEGPFGFAYRIRAVLIFIGGTSVFSLSMLALCLRKKTDLLVAFTALPPLVTWAAVYYAGKGEMTLQQGLQVGLLASAGFMIIYKFFAHFVSGFLKRNGQPVGDRLFLLSWLISVLIVYFLFGIPYVSVRHLLLLFPPIILLFMREVEGLWPARPRRQKLFIGFTLFFTAATGITAAIADYRFASIYPEIARKLGEQYSGYGASEDRVFVRGEFDFRYYLERQNFEMLHNKSEVKSGDIIIFSRFAASVTAEPWPEGSYAVISQIEPEDSFPFRIMNPWAGAGFYGHPMGPLPLVYSRDALDRITVYQIQVAQ